jgi:Holliday junction resolvase RusA-like endonuclease
MSRAPQASDIWPVKGAKPVRVEQRFAATGSFGLDCDARREVERVEISLPYPPATNNLYFNVAGRGRVKSDRYTQWLEESAWSILAQKAGRIAGKFLAEITVSRPDNRRRDLDGVLKPLLDCCVKNRLIRDDSLCQKIILAWSEGGEGVRIVLTKMEVSA